MGDTLQHVVHMHVYWGWQYISIMLYKYYTDSAVHVHVSTCTCTKQNSDSTTCILTSAHMKGSSTPNTSFALLFPLSIHYSISCSWNGCIISI